MNEMAQTTIPAPARSLPARFDSAGWGLLFILFGALALPRGEAESALVALTGAGMLVLNAARLRAGIEVSWFGVVLGMVAVVAGLGALVGAPVPAVPLFFVLLGLATIVGALVRER